MTKLCDEPLERQDGCAYEPIVPPVCTTQNHDTTSARHVRTAAESPAPPHAIALGHQLPGRQFSSSLCHARTAAGWRGREQGGLPYLGGCALRMCWCALRMCWRPCGQCPRSTMPLTRSLAYQQPCIDRRSRCTPPGLRSTTGPCSTDSGRPRPGCTGARLASVTHAIAHKRARTTAGRARDAQYRTT